MGGPGSGIVSAERWAGQIAAQKAELTRDADMREIARYPGYNFTSDGRIISYKKLTPRYLTPTLHHTGYLVVSVASDEHKHVSRPVHSLIAEAFFGPRPDELQIRHFDGDKLNNRVSNLMYGTPKENGEDSARLDVCKGDKNGHATLTAEQVQEVRRSNKSGVALAAEYGVQPAAIYRIRKGVSWGWLEEEDV
jgi:hypothetical protein